MALSNNLARKPEHLVNCILLFVLPLWSFANARNLFSNLASRPISMPELAVCRKEDFANHCSNPVDLVVEVENHNAPCGPKYFCILYHHLLEKKLYKQIPFSLYSCLDASQLSPLAMDWSKFHSPGLSQTDHVQCTASN